MVKVERVKPSTTERVERRAAKVAAIKAKHRPQHPPVYIGAKITTGRPHKEKLTPDELHIREVDRRDFRRALARFNPDQAGRIEMHTPPHRNTGTPERKHFQREHAKRSPYICRP